MLFAGQHFGGDGVDADFARHAFGDRAVVAGEQLNPQPQRVELLDRVAAMGRDGIRHGNQAEVFPTRGDQQRRLAFGAQLVDFVPVDTEINVAVVQ